MVEHSKSVFYWAFIYYKWTHYFKLKLVNVLISFTCNI